MMRYIILRNLNLISVQSWAYQTVKTTKTPTKLYMSIDLTTNYDVETKLQINVEKT